MDTSKPDRWELKSSDVIADCRVFKVKREDFRRSRDGKEADFYVIDSPDWVNVVPVTSGGEILMIEQFRQGTRSIILELPGGIVDEGEDPADSAKRELKEETGYTSENWVKIGSSRPNPALQSNTVHYYAAFDCDLTDEPSFDPNESLVTRLVPRSEIDSLIRKGEITHSLIHAAFMHFRLYRSAEDR